MQALVTGANGFVGRHLVAGLAAEGVDVLAGVRDLRQVCGMGVNLRGIRFDLDHLNELSADDLRGVDCIYHLAARVHVMQSLPSHEAEFHAVNAVATERLARIAAEAGVPRFVYVSSIKVNGERTSDRPFTSADSPAPQDAYARSKLAAEQALLDVGRVTDLQVVILRPPLVYGPGVGANFRRLVTLVQRGAPLPLRNVRNRRSMINVWNLVDALKHAARTPSAYGKVWLVSDGDDVSTPRLVELIARYLGRPARLWSLPVPLLGGLGSVLGHRPEVDRLVDSLQIDISSTRATLRWFPPLPVEEGIARTIDWIRSAASVCS